MTVGISRSEETLLRVPLVAHALEGGASAESLSYRALRTLAALDTAVEEVQGFTRYRIEGEPSDGATIEVVGRGGSTVGVPSRTDDDGRLLGTKRRAAEEREIIATVGARDGRTLILVPEVSGSAVSGMTLLHVRFRDLLPREEARDVLSGYRDRYAALAAAVTETEATFADEHLESIPVVELLTEPVRVLAQRWSQVTSGSGAD